MAKHPHIIVATEAKSKQFTSPSSGPHERFSLPKRTRAEHAEHLAEQIERLEPAALEKIESQKNYGLDAGVGIYLTFQSEPNFPLKFESLDLVRSGIELCNVRAGPDNSTQATVFVPDGKLDTFLTKIATYRDNETKPRTEKGVPRPKHQDLVESISAIQLAALEALWTEETIPFPQTEEAIVWEVWLRRAGEVDQLARLRQHSANFDLEVQDEVIKFVDRTVVQVRGTIANLARSIDILGMIAEIRLPKRTAAFFTEMDASEQQQWVAALATRLVPPVASAPAVCLLDTGINDHPLLTPLSHVADRHTYKPAWGADDRQGHGTPMAGLACHGDLAGLLGSEEPVHCTHRVESVKMIHQPDPHDPELYGAITRECVYRVEVNPDRQRVYCTAISATDGRDRGAPSSWSAAVDALTSGADDEVRRLFILSAGNTNTANRRDYPDSNMTDSIHDPGQAWNALTVGGFTEKDVVDTTRYPDWVALASRGDLAPCSCTSTTWGRWPIKPDIVMEAGNMAKHPDVDDPDYIDDGLQLLTTGHRPTNQRPLVSFGDTSAASALAARLAAKVWAKYPALSPETVRGLLAHSAEWTPAMLARFTDQNGTIDHKNLMRCFGRGVPDEQRLMSSLHNSLTLIAEKQIHPFHQVKGSVKSREMQPHPLPWPTEVLTSLQNANVRMKVTLSYFIEPSPGARGWTAKYGYQSHGLRFAVRKPLESETAFESRINKAAREDDYKNPRFKDDGWELGWNLRGLVNLGCVHTDVWHGKAIDLAARGYITVYPTTGWWNKRQHLNAWHKPARYSLIVSIETPEQDIYTAIANQISIPIEIEA